MILETLALVRQIKELTDQQQNRIKNIQSLYVCIYLGMQFEANLVRRRTRTSFVDYKEGVIEGLLRDYMIALTVL